MYHCLSQGKWGDLLPVTHAPCAQSPNNLRILDNSKATANDVPSPETDPHTPSDLQSSQFDQNIQSSELCADVKTKTNENNTKSETAETKSQFKLHSDSVIV